MQETEYPGASRTPKKFTMTKLAEFSHRRFTAMLLFIGSLMRALIDEGNTYTLRRKAWWYMTKLHKDDKLTIYHNYIEREETHLKFMHCRGYDVKNKLL